MKGIEKKILASKVIWRLSGISYPSAVIATTGVYLSKNDYLISGKNGMREFLHYFDKHKTVLEFGCGPGRNLFGLADRIKFGYGIDVNSHYIKLAKKLAKKYNLTNLEFLSYDGINFPSLPAVDIIVENGVFERLDKTIVISYLKDFSAHLNIGGAMILYFLMERAKGTEFSERLGDSAYFFWNHDEVDLVLKQSNLAIEDIIEGQYASFYVCKLE